MSKVDFVALIGNVNASILNVELGDGFRIEEWPIEKFVGFYEYMHGSAEHDIWFKLDDAWGYGHGRMYRPKNVYVVTKVLEEFPSHDLEKGQEKWLEAFRKRDIAESRVTNLLEDKIIKLRLLSEGSIKVCVEFFYSNDDGDLEMESSREEGLHCENRLYKIKKSDLDLINNLLKSPPINSRRKYINFAINNFSQAYRVAHTDLEFITLMIALEAIFNDGKQELRNKVSRGCAVLLGKTKASSRKIFKDVRDLYDKRSVLVHTGDTKKISRDDVLSLQSYVRRGLLRVLELDLTKDDLSVRLTENGFGSYSKIKS